MSWLKRIMNLLIAATLVSLWILPSVSALGLSPPDQKAVLNDENQSVTYNGCGYSSTSTSTTDITPGIGAPDGTTFPKLDPSSMASAINQWITQQNPNSELKGLGSTIVASAKHANINPFLLVAIPNKESSLADPSDFNVSHGNNSFGRTAGPGQPSFQGARSWYKWSSVKASVDYTASENQGITGGGDMATYISIEFPNEIRAGDLIALMNRYAPPSENDTAKYTSDLKSWISQLVALAGGTPTQTASSSSSPDSSTSAAGCNSACTAGSSPTANSDTIALDPGHSPKTNASERDAQTGLFVQDYPNSQGPEMPDVFNAATKIKAKLEADHYKVFMTKASVDDKQNLAQRAQKANASGAALLVTMHSNNDSPSPSYWLGYPDSNSVRIPGKTNTPSNRTDGKTGLVHPEVEGPSKKFAETMAPIIAKGIGASSYTARSFNDIYGTNGLGGNGLNYGNTPVQTILTSIPEVYSEVSWKTAESGAFVDAMTQAIEAAVPLSGNSSSSSSAADQASGSCSAVAGNAVQTAINFAWADGRNTPTQKPSYKNAVVQDQAAGKYIGGGSPVGDDCGGFVTRAMQDSGADPNYGGGGNTLSQESYMINHPQKYQQIHPGSTADLKPGDIAINADHTYMYVGKQPGFATTIASASLYNRAPTAGGEMPADPSFQWFRLIN